jgi:hypothetical protein
MESGEILDRNVVACHRQIAFVVCPVSGYYIDDQGHVAKKSLQVGHIPKKPWTRATAPYALYSPS